MHQRTNNMIDKRVFLLAFEPIVEIILELSLFNFQFVFDH